MELLKTKILICKVNPLNDYQNYLDALSPDLGFKSFLSPKQKNKSGNNNFISYQLLNISYWQKKNSLLVHEAEVIYPFPALQKSPEAQLCAKILVKLMKDWAMEQETNLAPRIYTLLIYALYSLETALLKENFEILDLLKIVLIVRLRFLIEAGYLQNEEDNFIKGIVSLPDWRKFYQHLKNSSYQKLFNCSFSQELYAEADLIIEKYWQHILDYNNEDLERLLALKNFEDASQKLMLARRKKASSVCLNQESASASSSTSASEPTLDSSLASEPESASDSSSALGNLKEISL